FKPLLARVREDPVFRRAYGSLPTAFAVVELDRLVVRQKTINLAQVRRLQQQLGPDADAKAVFRLCLPFDHPTIPPRVTALPDGGFEFASPSNDLRFLEAVALRPEQVPGLQSVGPVAGVVGLVVGYGSNYLNAIAAEGRLVLHNGSHRAFALRDLGLTYAPCVIQHARTPAELARAATGALRRRPDAYLKRRRPPLFKDYFDPRLRQLVRLPPVVRQVRVRFTGEGVDPAGGWGGGAEEESAGGGQAAGPRSPVLPLVRGAP